MSENLKIYNAVRQPPKEALKPIAAGRMKGKTDINPMWRIKALTEQFGPCGIGWKYDILDERLEESGEGQIAAFVKINLFYKYNGEWSEPVPGTGGNMFVTREKAGLHVSDECFKMALTDAISVACKAIGVGADIYWDSDRSKYDKQEDKQEVKQAVSDAQIKRLYAISKAKGITEEQVKEVIKKEYKKESTKDLTRIEYDAIIKRMEAKEDKK